MLTARGLGLLVGAAIAVAVGRLLGVGEMLVLATVAVALVVLAAVSVHFAASTVAVRRGVSTPRLEFGQAGQATLELRNESRLPTALLLVEDHCPAALGGRPRFVVPALTRGTSRVLRYPVHGRARGCHVLGPVTIRVQDPFGLAERTRRTAVSTQVLVRPRVHALEQGRPRGSHEGVGTTGSRRLFSTADEFHSMREYVRGDDLRHVHWPSTARRQALMVRQNEQSPQPRVTVLCDTREAVHLGRGPGATLETAVSVAASVLAGLAKRGYALRLLTDGSQGRPPVEPVDMCLDRLAQLRAGGAHALQPALELLHGQSGQGLLVAVLGPPSRTDDPIASADVRALRQTSRFYQDRVAIIVIDPARRMSAARGRQLADVLAGSGWRASTIGPGDDLAPVWKSLMSARHRSQVPPGEAVRR